MVLGLYSRGIIGIGIGANLSELAMSLLTHIGICSFIDTFTD